MSLKKMAVEDSVEASEQVVDSIGLDCSDVLPHPQSQRLQSLGQTSSPQGNSFGSSKEWSSVN